MDTVIEFHNVWKSFKLGQNIDSLRDLIPQVFEKFRSGNHNPKKRRETFWALKDVSFEIKQGETVGLIGPNGSGKTTTLKLLSGILRQTKGEILKKGRIGALIEIGAGFHGDLTGRENIYLNGSIMGMKKWEVNKRFDEIVAFAEVEDFIDTPVKRFSSGMYVRLGFSVAAHLEPDILLIDEVLAVGDAWFQSKCRKRIKELQELGTSIVLVSHHMGLVDNICAKAILLEHGEVTKHDHVELVIPFYQQKSLKKQEFQNEQNPLADIEKKSLEILSVTIEQAELTGLDRIRVRILVMNRLPGRKKASVHVEVYSEAGVMLHRSSTYMDGVPLLLEPGRTTIYFESEARFFLKGIYYISSEIMEDDDEGCVDWKPHAAHFEIIDGKPDLSGLLSLPRRWQVDASAEGSHFRPPV
jgi:lipopolysaccharide transport system ATP-binding protein